VSNPPDDIGPFRTPLTAALGIRHPILLAPMGGTAGGKLAAAVSDAGGLGLIGGGYADPTWLHDELDAAGGARVGVGFITFALDERPATLDIALAAHPPAIQLSFGDPRPYADAIHRSDALLICQVQADHEIALAIEAGADVIVAQGRDAGGHGRPDRGIVGLVPSVIAQASPIPVVAAGGFADGRGLAAALMLGASGITLGTRFLASSEALSTSAEAAAVVDGRAGDTVRTEAFDAVRGPAWPPGHDGRALRNELVARWDDGVDHDELRRAFRRSASDDHTIRPVWVGEGLDVISSIEPAADIVAAVVADAKHAIESAQGLLVQTSEMGTADVPR
jgi:nitronate monooxygenase